MKLKVILNEELHAAARRISDQCLKDCTWAHKNRCYVAINNELGRRIGINK